MWQLNKTLGEEYTKKIMTKEKDHYGKDLLKLKLEQMRADIQSEITEEFYVEHNVPPKMDLLKNPLNSDVSLEKNLIMSY